MNEFLKATLKANQEIATALSGCHDDEWYEKKEIGFGGDISSGLDLFAENIFFNHLHSFGSIESEESGVMNDGEATIIIDPIDGSDNALSGMPYFGTSVARLGIDGVLKDAMVCNLCSNEYFFTSVGSQPKYGKLFDDRVEHLEVLSRSKVGIFERAYAYPQIVKALNINSVKFRSPGAVALSLAYAHWVDFVLFAGAIRIYDVVAGLALCEGLEVIIKDDYVIVSKEKDIAAKIEQIMSDIQTKEK
jgi:myo-inositol-1(or 4)-monophosphatase